MEGNLRIWNAVKQPPTNALKQISGGRLNGKTDINPQWRYKVMTEQFGICGTGWKYEIVRTWTEPATDGQIFAFAEIKLFVSIDGKWSDAIPGLGGHMMVEKESKGLHANDEGYKMAITDSLSVAMKMLGVAADIYAGLWDGTKYKDSGTQNAKSSTQSAAPKSQSDAEWDKLKRPEQVPGSNEWILVKMAELKINEVKMLEYLNKDLHIPVESTIKATLEKAKISDADRSTIAQKINAKAKQEVK